VTLRPQAPAPSTFRNSNTGGVSDVKLAFTGVGSGCTPIAGDWDGM
jgi:hypothetical protein